MLEIKNLNFAYDEYDEIFSNANITIKENGIYYLDAPNGTGKTTLFKILMGRLKYSGNITIDGSPDIKNKITYIEYSNVIRRRARIIDQIKIFTDDEDYIQYLLDEFLLNDVKNNYPNKVSDGERSRFAFLLGMLENNKIIIIDELFSHLDFTSANIIRKYIYNLSNDRIIIFTSHKDDFKIQYNYHIGIIDNNFQIEKCNSSITSEALDFSKLHFNFKYVAKILEIKFRYLFGLLSIVIFSLIIGYFSSVISYNENELEYRYVKSSRTIPYVIPVRFYKDYLYRYTDQIDFNYSDYDYAIPLLRGYNFFDFPDLDIIKTKNTEILEYQLGFSHRIPPKRVCITESYNNKKLLDDEIILTDEYFSKLYGANQALGILEEVDGTYYLKFKGFRMKIRELIETSKFSFNEPGDIYNKNMLKKLYFEDSIYLNRNAYQKIKNLARKKVEDVKFYVRNYDFLEVFLDTLNDSTKLTKGRLPENEDEILVNPNKIYGQLNSSLKTQLNLLAEKPDDSNYQLVYLFKEYKVVGFTSEKDVVFYNEKAYSDYLDTYDTIDVKYLGINQNEISLEEFLELKAKGYDVMFSEYINYENSVRRLDDSMNSNRIIITIISSILAILVISYTILERYFYGADIRCLYQKSIPANKINSIRLKFNLKTFILLALELSLAFSLVWAFDIYFLLAKEAYLIFL